MGDQSCWVGWSSVYISMLRHAPNTIQPLWDAAQCNRSLTNRAHPSWVLSASFSNYCKSRRKILKKCAIASLEGCATQWIAIDSMGYIYPRLIAPGLATRILFLNYLHHPPIEQQSVFFVKWKIWCGNKSNMFGRLLGQNPITQMRGVLWCDKRLIGEVWERSEFFICWFLRS